MLGEICQKEKDKYYMILLIYGIKEYYKLVNIIVKKQIHRYREQTNSYQWRKGSGQGQDRDRRLKDTNYYI